MIHTLPTPLHYLATKSLSLAYTTMPFSFSYLSPAFTAETTWSHIPYRVLDFLLLLGGQLHLHSLMSVMKFNFLLGSI